jgi:serine/threonine protein phosphatase 1
MENRDKKIAIISDIHGCYETMMRLINKIPLGYEIVLCGDLIDRGPNSKDVVEYAMNNKIRTVLGNHEHLMLFHHDQRMGYSDKHIWLYNGGLHAIHSFGGFIPTSVLRWADGLPTKIIEGNLLISHTGHGLNKNEFDAVWCRDIRFPSDSYFRVFGHTQAIEPIITDRYAMIDTGCAYKSRGFGKLTAFLWPEKEIIQVNNCEKSVKSDEIL